MKSKRTERLLRFLIVLLGVGVGLALTLFADRLVARALPEWKIRVEYLGIAYGGMAILGGLIFLLLNRRILNHFVSFTGHVEKTFDKMPVYQLFSSIIGLILGLIVAALLCRMLSFMGNGMFTAVLSAILYLTLGAFGFNIGRKRSREFTAMLTRFSGSREKSKVQKHGYAARKFLDTSAIIDGRILEVCKTGFIEGELVVPSFIVDELRHVADSSDDSKRERGRRGLEILASMREELRQLKDDETDWDDVTDADVKLIRLARECGGTVITGDYNLIKAAQVSYVKALNINDLAGAMRPAVTQGMELTLRLTKEGKDPSQGVGYMSDGTMVVVENGRKHLGEDVSLTVTSVLQTSAGRMVFARLSEPASV